MLRVMDTNSNLLKDFEFSKYELMELSYLCESNGTEFNDAEKERFKKCILDFKSRSILQGEKLLAVTIEKEINSKELYIGLLLNSAIGKTKRNNISLFRTYKYLLAEGLKIFDRIITCSLDFPALNRHHKILGFKLEKKDIINGFKYNQWFLEKPIYENKNKEEI
jgi:hypothetical protein